MRSNSQRQKVGWWLSWEGDGELVFNGYSVSVWENGKVLEINGDDDYITL